jgi:uncharacterized protein YkwD
MNLLKITKQYIKLDRIIILILFFNVFNFIILSPVQANDNTQTNQILQNNEAIDNWEVINLVNLERGSRGLNYLEENKILNKVAESKLNDMVANNYFAHTSPAGINPWHWFNQHNYNFEYAGENLAKDFKTAKKQHQAWMESPTHKENILNREFTETGVAVQEKFFKGERMLITVQVFATPKQVVVASPNFTPQTYQVPTELLTQNMKNENFNLEKKASLAGEVAGTFKSQSLKELLKQENFQFKLVAWLTLIMMTIIIVVVEYKIFIKKYNCEIGDVF